MGNITGSSVLDSILTMARCKMKDPSESVISWILTNGSEFILKFK